MSEQVHWTGRETHAGSYCGGLIWLGRFKLTHNIMMIIRSGSVAGWIHKRSANSVSKQNLAWSMTNGKLL
ncbi:hypothetical protein, partial [Sulfitobacter mediterraneus]|uniref:hypothetical protein n=1 Tax=Sulfitobacter mediterraneus TaxID=83219 RepID=UPI001EEE6B3B